MMRSALLALSLAVGAATLSGSALAREQPHKEMTAEQRREAEKLFNEGHLAYDEADYEKAILKWKRSLDISGLPLINEAIAKAYEKLGNVKQAHRYLTEWRQHAPPEEHGMLDKRLQNLYRRVEAQELAAREEAERREREEAQRKAREEELRRQREATAGKDPGDTGTDGGLTTGEIIGWTAVGVGAAAVIAGLVVDAVAASSRPDEDEACNSAGDKLLCRGESQDDIETSNTLAIAGDITWIAGGAIAVTGVVLLFTMGTDDVPANTTGSTRFVPVLSPGHAGLMISSSF